MVDEGRALRGEVWRHFKGFQSVFLATVEGNQPRVRPVTLIYFDNGVWKGVDDLNHTLIEIEPVEIELRMQN